MRPSIICLFLLVGCGRSDVRLLDGRFLGSAGDRDGGPPAKDAGFSDAGIPVCAFAGEDLNLSPDLFEPTFRFELAEVLSIDPLRLGFFDGTVITFHYDKTDLFRGLGLGDLVFALVEVTMPFWLETQLALFERAPNDGVGDVIAAAWEVTREISLELGELRLDYDDDPCSPSSDVASCGLAVTRGLRASLGDQMARISAGDEARLGALIVGNGRSYRYAPMPSCTDTPSGWFSGYVIRAPGI